MKQRGICTAESRRGVGRQTQDFRCRSRMLRQLGRKPAYPPPNSAAAVRCAGVACGGGATLTTVAGAADAAVAAGGAAGANSREAVAVDDDAARALARRAANSRLRVRAATTRRGGRGLAGRPERVVAAGAVLRALARGSSARARLGCGAAARGADAWWC